MNNRIAFALLIPFLALSACTTTSKVAVVRREDVKGFQSLGSVRSTVPFGGLFKNLTYTAALNKALDQAEKMGATHFVLDEESGPTFIALSETARGTAYKQTAAAATNSSR